MTRLDQNRAVALLAQQLAVGVDAVCDLVVWGNHSPSMFPDLFNATVNGDRAVDQVDMDWYENEYIPRVGKRGAEIIEARGASSRVSGQAAIDHVRDGSGAPTACARWRSAPTAPTGGRALISSFPVRCANGSYEIVQGLDVGESPSQARRDGERADRRACRGQRARVGVIFILF